jgi:hypothetical protein
MKDLTTYVNESINESLLGMIAKFFTNKLKTLQKKFSLSENSVNDLGEKLAEPQDTLNNELKELSKGKISDSDKWWKQLLKVKPELAKAVSPIEVNNSIMTNLLNISGVYKKALDSWEATKILDTLGIQYHIKRDIAQLVILAEGIAEDNSKQSNVSNQLKKIEVLLKQITLKDKEAKKILDETLDNISGKADEILRKAK